MKYLIATSVLIIVILSILFVLYNSPAPIINPQQPDNGNTIETPNESKSTRVDFMQEHITIDVYQDSVAVTGIYCFRVNEGGPGIIPILYPFPVDGYHEFPAYITVINGEGQPVKFTEDRAAPAIHFLIDLTIEPEFTVSYTQRITGATARYILTTTSAWGKPLERAEFTISMPETFQQQSFSYEPDSETLVDGRRIFSLARSSFMPNRDLIVTWNE